MQKLESLGRLAGSVAHDFNNILTAIAGSASYLARSGREVVLLAEDDMIVRETTAQVLRAFGYTVLTAAVRLWCA